ncbi:MAG: hypothetical protein J1D88_02475 [Treponema sp.]|nr:hypothetical protein [Treponema sp.]
MRTKGLMGGSDFDTVSACGYPPFVSALFCGLEAVGTDRLLAHVCLICYNARVHYLRRGFFRRCFHD